ncbi:GNAT family N-acetyltransferase [Flavobacterium psychrophilum]|uniref:GNAT family N-acetyltransferase n=1 Tax=Flavobacterium psychrophilum TaxID=96345 RepID=UPI001C8F551E|nr:GNAT family N-acetyltransferase [Flavobacterium psychrophilum]EKT4499676.1 GNAT family N-acetyltransferase [Flavobacterium psychrophilum]ELM3651047.1 GNAT family N-acetyltransferase [Flavobacterium psychrophilum]ELM3672230.1 GNAT family N-acetyltransferase [Flavobacterium psychrophilum]ELM3726020.1 GNAT family N-acetyltransferase [Flavobacterium psychrophilum]QZK96960.1 GNAT family N-acetyltransferase [Flavobacterium psychrophilum]
MTLLAFKIKPFKEISTQELYEVLRLRSEVFVVEQNCVYQDIDSKDQEAIHVLGYYNGELAAYCRLFDAGNYFDNASIGRVIVAQKFRGKKWGNNLIVEAITVIKQYFGKREITISAQLYLQKFYESHGFAKTSEMYLEDDIPHIEMKIH